MSYFPKPAVLYAYAAIVLWVACLSSSDNKGDTAAGDASPAGFDTFFARFKSDSAFQAAHVVYPLHTKTDFWNDSKMITMETQEWVEAKDWTFFNFDMDGEGDMEWQLSKKSTGNNAVVELRSMHNRLGVDLLFAYTEGAWRLTTLHNRTTISQYQGLYAIGVSDEFKQFFETFRSDENFQIEYSSLGELKYLYPSDEGDSMLTKYVTHEDWRMHKFSNAGPREGENLEYIVEQEGNQAKVWARCLDCGVSLTYFFEPHANAWKLVRIEDHSM